MIILFEGYKYPLNKVNLTDYLDKNYVNTDDNSTSYVGYYHRPNEGGGDVVFILPKVFIEIERINGSLEKHLKPFGRNKNTPEEFLLPCLFSDGEKEFLFNFSMWIHSAIKKYSNICNKEDRAEDLDFHIASSKNYGDKEETLIEIALALKEFNRKHSQLLTYITKLNSSGNNNIDWGKTISTKQPVFQVGTPIYFEFVNRTKAINFDEEIIILFYSVLNYISEKYSVYRVKMPINYKIYPSYKIQEMIDSEAGTKLLWAIRRKYFTDELVELWNLVYNFFEHEEISYGKENREYLLINKFENVFEAMVDDLLGYDPPKEIGIEKKQKDGKRIDHLYLDYSLLGNDEDRGRICFIGDSKYYREMDAVKENIEAVSKQYTYAKNIIQYSIDACLNKNKLPGIKYRDDITEGYNITPNFFLRGEIKFTDDEQLADYVDQKFISEESTTQFPVNKQFEDRLFDRDTLLLKAFNINFLYLLSLYISDNASSKRAESRCKILNSIITGLHEKYIFYRVFPDIPANTSGDSCIKNFANENFRDFIGTMYYDCENKPDKNKFIWFAFEKNSKNPEHDISKIKGKYRAIEKATFSDGTWKYQQVYP